MVNGISWAEQQEARKAGVPEHIIDKMRRSDRLTEGENDRLHKEGYAYVPGFRKRTGYVRAYLRRYLGGTPKRMRSLKLARSVSVGFENPEHRVPGYKPMTPRERAEARPGGEI